MKTPWMYAGVTAALVGMALTGCGSEADEGSAIEQDASAAAETADGQEDWPETIRFAVTGIDGMEELQRRYEEFQDVIEEHTGVDFEFFALSNRTVASTAMEADQVDMVLSGPSEYAQTKGAAPGVEPLAAIERDAYHSVFVVHEDSEFEELEDLRGESIAMKEAGSTSGHIGPSAILIDEGLDDDIEVELLGDARIEAFKSGETTALADGVRAYDRIVEEDGEDAYRIIHEGPPLPQDPFVASPELPESFKETFTEILHEHEDEILDAILDHEENDKYDGAKIVDIEDEDYDLMRETYDTLGIELQ
ncbi:phosphonate transport system substrate-binding protein [Salsuginibacillus halophilus]|uniref:Phosphonate transport system substrate-binding protein n=1 Tax=Salsuginibacillus halophilus TaxID=517424 RepID=A0A2P8H861_9BACI|nr:PhnD/SsuA/transferrin family substrate-binding protein [Salsuginibacillus halophilus]PSL42402.1 phosphonate transport system substrate-binding protein [Salsuginibacillus halophilus]